MSPMRHLYGVDIRALNVFLEVVRQGGFTAASRHLFLTQPSISRVIKQIEDEVGQQLILRDRRQIALTDAGKVVYDHAVALVAASARLSAEISDLAGLRRGDLVLGLPPLAGTLFVPLVKQYVEQYPAIELQMFEKGSKATETALLEGELELGVLKQPVDAERFNLLPVAKDHLVLTVPTNSKWAKRRSIRLAELKNEPLIFFPEDFALNDTILAACRSHGFEPKIGGRSGQLQFIIGLIEAGLGSALLPTTVLRGMNQVASVKVVEPVINWNIALAWPRNIYLSHAARALLAVAKSHPLT
jgi:DNA-binding transcriptional LysR family regulator